MFGFLKKMFAPAADYQAMMANGAVIVDVRTPGEYQSGHIQGSLNIPLDTIPTEIGALANKGVPVITCCRSGMRSGAAARLLQQAGIEAVNGGAWDQLERRL